MTNEEIQRVMELIVRRQETFIQGMEQLRGAHAQAEGRISKLDTAVVGLYSIVTDISAAHRDLIEKVSGLADSISELAGAQAHTEQRVNVLIDILMQGRNGKSEDQT